MKNDQGGDRKQEPRHVYSNPLDPVVCPVLSLAIYFSIFNISGTKDSALFPGFNQYKRFSKYLEKLCVKYEFEIKNDYGVDISEIMYHLGPPVPRHRWPLISGLDGPWGSSRILTFGTRRRGTSMLGESYQGYPYPLPSLLCSPVKLIVV